MIVGPVSNLPALIPLRKTDETIESFKAVRKCTSWSTRVPDKFLFWLRFSSVMVPAPFHRRALPKQKFISAIVPSVLLLGIMG